MRPERAFEKAIASATIAAILAAGPDHCIDVNDGEEIVLSESRDPSAILAAMFSTDEDYLVVRSGKNASRDGWIRFIYGNSGFDVINDYTTNLESILDPVTGIRPDSVSSRLETGDFRIVLD